MRDKTSAPHDFVKGLRRPSAPPVEGTTYEYLVSEVAHRKPPAAYNIYGRSLPKKALKSLHSHHPWGLHIGGDDLINTFNVLDPTMGGLYYPAISTPIYGWKASSPNTPNFIPNPSQTPTHSQAKTTPLSEFGASKLPPPWIETS